MRWGADRLLLLLVASMLLVPAGAARAGSDAASTSTAYKRCRDVVLRNPDGSVYTQTHGLFEKHATCGLARRLARRYLSDDGERPARILGFACSGGSDGVACRKGHKRVTWGYSFDRPAVGV